MARLARQTLTSPAIYRWFPDEGVHVEVEYVDSLVPFITTYAVYLNDEPIGFVAVLSPGNLTHEEWVYAKDQRDLGRGEPPTRVRLSAVAALVEPLRPNLLGMEGP